MIKRVVVLITICLISVCMIAGCGGGKAGEPDIRAYCDRKHILIGDRIRYTIEASAQAGTEIRLPEFKDGLMGEFEIKVSAPATKSSFLGRNTFKKVYRVTSFLKGARMIPPAEIQYKNKLDKDWKAAKTKEIIVTIGSVLPKDGLVPDIKDIKGPIYFGELNPLLTALIILLLIISAAVLLYIRKKSRRPVKLPHETALEEIEALKAALARTGDIKAFYVGISDCARNYIERRFMLKAPEMTTEEFFESLKSSAPLSVDHKRLLHEFLEACDLVKFAKHMPAREETESALAAARNFVEETKEEPAKP